MSIAARSHTASTPALRVLNLAGVEYSVFEFEHDPNVRRYGTEVSEKLGIASDRVFKTLMILVDGEPITALVPVSGQLDLKALATAIGGKKAQLAGIAETERRTGYQTGGVSPFGQRRTSPVVIDRTAQDHETVYISGGRRGLEIEMRPDDLAMLTDARIAKIAAID
ncbi:Cys-tRNA(Pro) deacylase [Brevibacterium sp. 5221]|uniref:Cys-tRNA(Pro)/Cys-tRNA(Cys) deacylase n=1 Tax=Brevibacterium rongguiense TaxID=2695267 RepID=A0A6N9H6Z1_9MICO|nr:MULTISPECIES: Cys-tRNA(Pro) deacylase [Brevibacterium]MYM19675.1 Cys-tRNA(Pro) deacylase [Brevibacterium rongguiense]WAL39921.1 Cys-tRNA(Pro) deacylase [Brevibacterium sp. BRM-1]